MKTQNLKTLRVALTALACATVSLEAATRDKADNADDLNLTNSWVGGLAPGSADVGRFDNEVTGPITVSLGADTEWSQIRFNDPGGDVTISAGHTLTLNNNNPIIFGTGTTDLTLDCDVDCGGASFSTLRSAPTGRTVTYNGTIDGRDALVTIGNTSGTLRLGSPDTIRIGSAVRIITAGVKVGIGASSIGSPIVSGPLGTNRFDWQGGSAELFAYDGDQTLGNPVRILSTMTFNSTNELTFTGDVNLNGGSRTINVASNGILRFTGVISNGNSITKSGPGILEFGGPITASLNSGITFNDGTIRLLSDDVVPDAGGALRMSDTGQVFDLNGFDDTIRGVTAANGFGSSLGTIDNTAPGTASVLTLGDDFNTYTLAGVIQNSGAGSTLAIVNTGTGALSFTNDHPFSGGVTIAGGRLNWNASGGVGTGPVTVTSPDTTASLAYEGADPIQWTNSINLASNAQPGVFSTGGILDIGSTISGEGQLRRTGDGTSMVTLSADNTFSGGFTLESRSVTLDHSRAVGTGTLSLGSPTTSGSSLTLIGGIDLSGATAITNAVILNRTVTIGGTNPVEFTGPWTLATTFPQPTINVDTPAGVVIAGPIAGGAGFGFNKTGSGLLTLTAASTYDGPTSISTGPLALGPGAALSGTSEIFLGGSGKLDVSAVSNFTIEADQTLRGSGPITGNVTMNGTLQPSGFMATLTFSNDLTLAAGSTTIVVALLGFGGTEPEQVVCNGTLTFGGDLVVTNLFGGSAVAGESFDLFGFTTSTGTFAGVTLPPLDPGLIWNSDNLYVDGTISVAAVGGGAQPVITDAYAVLPSSFALTVTGGTPNAEFHLLSETNVTAPVTNWVAIATNIFDGTGALTFTNSVSPTDPQRVYGVLQP